ncbi:hypothetical protein FJY63_03895, partial [Candidatus Sumerlaeota bacterium]|nr:hypothetical protein [Candidatus Sumerlaeota bacterium]
MKHAILFVICLFLGSAIGSTETATFSLGSVRLANWARDGQIQKVVGIKLYDLIDGYADIHMGFNYVDS